MEPIYEGMHAELEINGVVQPGRMLYYSLPGVVKPYFEFRFSGGITIFANLGVMLKVTKK